LYKNDCVGSVWTFTALYSMFGSRGADEAGAASTNLNAFHKIWDCYHCSHYFVCYFYSDCHCHCLHSRCI